MSLLLFMAAALVAQPTDTSPDQDELIRVFGAGETMEWAVLPRSIQRTGDAAQAVVQVNHFRRTRLRARDEIEVAVDCRASRYRPLAITRHDLAGPSERRTVSESEFPMTLAQPRTGVAAALARICGARQDTDQSVNTRLQATPD